MHTTVLSRLATLPQSPTKHDPGRCHRSAWGHHVCPQVHRYAFAEVTVATALENGQKLMKRRAPVCPVQHYLHAAYSTRDKSPQLRHTLPFSIHDDWCVINTKWIRSLIKSIAYHTNPANQLARHRNYPPLVVCFRMAASHKSFRSTTYRAIA